MLNDHRFYLNAKKVLKLLYLLFLLDWLPIKFQKMSNNKSELIVVFGFKYYCNTKKISARNP